MRALSIAHNEQGLVGLLAETDDASLDLVMPWRGAVELSHRMLITALQAACHLNARDEYDAYVVWIRDQIEAEMRDDHR